PPPWNHFEGHVALIYLRIAPATLNSSGLSHAQRDTSAMAPRASILNCDHLRGGVAVFLAARQFLQISVRVLQCVANGEYGAISHEDVTSAQDEAYDRSLC